jgi:hypothetical protein
MAKLGPEYIGKLPPGAAKDLQRELREIQASAKFGIVKGVKILPGPGCTIAEAQAEKVYPLDQVPNLPLPGCDRSPCCGCCYLAALI